MGNIIPTRINKGSLSFIRLFHLPATGMDSLGLHLWSMQMTSMQMASAKTMAGFSLRFHAFKSPAPGSENRPGDRPGAGRSGEEPRGAGRNCRQRRSSSRFFGPVSRSVPNRLHALSPRHNGAGRFFIWYPPLRCCPLSLSLFFLSFFLSFCGSIKKKRTAKNGHTDHRGVDNKTLRARAMFIFVSGGFLLRFPSSAAVCIG